MLGAEDTIVGRVCLLELSIYSEKYMPNRQVEQCYEGVTHGGMIVSTQGTYVARAEKRGFQWVKEFPEKMMFQLKS